MQKFRFHQRRRDQFFHLPTVLAENDPFLRRLYHGVALVLDDHPYPTTSDQYRRRSKEIQREIRHLHLSPFQNDFLRRLMTETNVTLVDLWHGSHVIVLDYGRLYQIWSNLPSAVERRSSHYKQIPLKQFGINFKDHQLLFGKTSINGSTWFQMEAHGFDAEDLLNDPDNIVFHGQDFLKYRVHDMNVGPFGFSPHTEEFDPIVVPYRPVTLSKTFSHNPRQLKH